MNSRGKLVAVVATAAVVITLSSAGTAVARNLIGSRDIRDGSIRMVDLNQAVVAAIGQVGEAGPAGPVGAQGPAGPQGERGPRGFAGQDGTDGADGTDGTDGTDGQDAGFSFTGESTNVAAAEDVYVTASCDAENFPATPRLVVYSADSADLLVSGTLTAFDPSNTQTPAATDVFSDDTSVFIGNYPDGQTLVLDLVVVPSTGRSYDLDVVYRAGQPCQGQGVLVPLGEVTP